MRGSEIANLNFGGPRCAGVYHSSPVVGHVNKEGFIAGIYWSFYYFGVAARFQTTITITGSRGMNGIRLFERLP